MRGDRMILRLVALGRLSPAEAERMLLAWNQERETAWMVAGCVALGAMVLLQAHAAAFAQVGHVVTLVSQVLGRVL